MTTVIFLRHGPTQENLEDRIQGHGPGQLLLQATERYLTAVTPLLRQKPLHHLISSDLERAVKTRQMLKKFLQQDLPEEAWPLLREKAMGQLEGQLWQDTPADTRLQRQQVIFDFSQHGGETSDDLIRRVTQTLAKLATTYPEQNICCITHGGWIRQLAQLKTNIPFFDLTLTNRTAIFETRLATSGDIDFFLPILIRAKLPRDDG